MPTMPNPAILSQRELQVVRLVCDGLCSKEIATKLELSVKTVETHRANINRKLFGDEPYHANSALLCRWAMTYGVVGPFPIEIECPS